jgi:hypothetical protein
VRAFPGRRPPSPAETFAKIVRQAEEFVSHERGLPFLRPVQIERLSRGAFERRLADAPALDVAGPSSHVPTLRALGLLSAEEAAQTQDLAASSVVGFYDPGTATVVMHRGGNETYVRYVLVHELVHALQDQHFALAGLGRGDLDADLAVTALIEGDAARVADDLLATLSTHELDEVLDGALRARDEMYRASLFVSPASFPYIAGRDFVRSLLASGGPRRLNAAMRAPPTTTSQIMHPERFLAGEAATPVATPRAEGELVDSGAMGEFELIMVLALAADTAPALRLASRWSGGSYVTFRRPGLVCTSATIALRSADDAAAIAAGLGKWAARTAATVGRPSPTAVALRACAPSP